MEPLINRSRFHGKRDSYIDANRKRIGNFIISSAIAFAKKYFINQRFTKGGYFP
jgi:hypothetical protein